MATSLTSAINLMEDVFINTAFFETFLITQLIALFGIMLFVSREPRDWPMLGFPVLVGMNAIGFYVNPLLIGASGLIMVINGLSVEGIQGALKTAKMATLGNISSMVNLRKDMSYNRRDKRLKSFEKEVSLLNRRDKITGLNSRDQSLLRQRLSKSDQKIFDDTLAQDSNLIDKKGVLDNKSSSQISMLLTQAAALRAAGDESSANEAEKLARNVELNAKRATALGAGDDFMDKSRGKTTTGKTKEPDLLSQLAASQTTKTFMRGKAGTLSVPTKGTESMTSKDADKAISAFDKKLLLDTTSNTYYPEGKRYYMKGRAGNMPKFKQDTFIDGREEAQKRMAQGLVSNRYSRYGRITQSGRAGDLRKFGKSVQTKDAKRALERQRSFMIDRSLNPNKFTKGRKGRAGDMARIERASRKELIPSDTGRILGFGRKTKIGERYLEPSSTTGLERKRKGWKIFKDNGRQYLIDKEGKRITRPIFSDKKVTRSGPLWKEVLRSSKGTSKSDARIIGQLRDYSESKRTQGKLGKYKKKTSGKAGKLWKGSGKMDPRKKKKYKRKYEK